MVSETCGFQGGVESISLSQLAGALEVPLDPTRIHSGRYFDYGLVKTDKAAAQDDTAIILVFHGVTLKVI